MSQKAGRAMMEFLHAHSAKLNGLPQLGGNIFLEGDLRLDMQGRTSPEAVIDHKTGKPKIDPTTKKPIMHQGYNLQVQINKDPKMTSLKKLAPKTLAFYKAYDDSTPDQIIAGLKHDFQTKFGIVIKEK